MISNKPTQIPLCVDLDGSLIKTDLLLESFLALFKKKPWVIFLVPFWVLKGKAYLKARISREIDLDASVLPYCEKLVALLRQECKNGRTLVLATASHEKYALGVAKHLGFFDEVIATSGSSNMTGICKANRLVERFGENGFDYIGNAKVDLKIWTFARQVIVINPELGVERIVRKTLPSAQIIKDHKPIIAALFRTLRIHQWLKNVLVFVALIATHKMGDLSSIILGIAAFFAFGLCASSVYILNDLLDLESDRHHATKSKRPFASGDVPILKGLFLLPILIGSAIAISLIWLPSYFLLCLGIYYLLTVVYSFWAKNKIVVDVMFLAGLYTIRIISGAAAISIKPSFWILVFAMFIFLSLAMVKRYAELLKVLKSGRNKAKGRGYLVDDLPLLQSLGGSSGYLSVLVLAFYINSSEAHLLYSSPVLLWALCPMLLFWISRMWFKTHRGEMHDDPIVFAAKDIVSILVLVICAVAFVLSNLVS
jgi:4-hydroxybenzoate polyprenyltransferase